MRSWLLASYNKNTWWLSCLFYSLWNKGSCVQIAARNSEFFKSCAKLHFKLKWKYIVWDDVFIYLMNIPCVALIECWSTMIFNFKYWEKHKLSSESLKWFQERLARRNIETQPRRVGHFPCRYTCNGRHYRVREIVMPLPTKRYATFFLFS